MLLGICTLKKSSYRSHPQENQESNFFIKLMQIILTIEAELQYKTLTKICMHFLVRSDGNSSILHLSLYPPNYVTQRFWLVQQARTSSQTSHLAPGSVGSERQSLFCWGQGLRLGTSESHVTCTVERKEQQQNLCGLLDCNINEWIHPYFII